MSRETCHSGNRGVRRGLLFKTPDDYARFERLLDRFAPKFDVDLYSVCLMPNHNHLQNNAEPKKRIEFLRRLHWTYAMGYNKKTDRHGHVFEERSWSFERWGPFWVPHTAAYIFLNPTLAGLGHPAEYAYSSYAATLGLRPVPAYLKPEKLLQYFSTDFREARVKLRRYVDDRLAVLGPIYEARKRWMKRRRRTARSRNLAMNLDFLAFTSGVFQTRLPSDFEGFGKQELVQIGLSRFEGAGQTLIACAMDMKTSTAYKRWHELQQALKGKPKLTGRIDELLNAALMP